MGAVVSGKSKKYEGFVSCRQPSKLLAGEIVQKLLAYDIQCGWQESSGQKTNKAHGPATCRMISEADFCVILIEPDFYSPSAGDEGTNYQFEEIDAALTASFVHERHTKILGIDATYVIFPVLLSEKAEVVDAEFLRALREDVPETLSDVYTQLSQVGGRLQIPEFLDSSSLSRNLAVTDVVQTITRRVMKLREAKKIRKEMEAKRQAEQVAAKQQAAKAAGSTSAGMAGGVAELAAEPPPPTPEELARNLVEAYVTEAASAWQKGKISGRAQLKSGPTVKGSTNPFAFVSTRFMQLDGELERGIRVPAGIERQPLSAWTLTRQPGILYLLGEAGAGKTTAAAAAAMAYAWSWQPQIFEKELAEFAGGDWLKQAKKYLGGEENPFLPITVSIPGIVSELDDLTVFRPADLIEAITENLRGEFSNKRKAKWERVTAAHIEALLGRHKIVLILDGLDEVGAGIGEQIHDAAKRLHRQLFDAETDRFRMIITSRPGLRGVSASDLQVRVQGPDWDAVEAFVEDYIRNEPATSASGQSHLSLIKNARSLFYSREHARRRIVRRPLFLNLLCHVSATDGDFQRHSFCEGVIAYLTESRDFTEIASRINKAGETVLTTQQIARKLLGWLAYATFLEGGSYGDASFNAAAKNLARRHTDFGLVPLDQKGAQAILIELATETNLMVIAKNMVSFAGQLLFCEYLVSEAIADANPEELVATIGEKHAENWKNALAFAESRLRQDDDSSPYSAALLARSQRLLAQDKINEAESFLSAALSVLDENTDYDLPGIRSEVHKAIEIYREGQTKWSLLQRDKFLRDLLPLASRDLVITQRKAVQSIFDTLLHPRKVWVDCKAPGLPAGYRMADSPVHVAAYTVFAQADDALNPEYWDHVPDEPKLSAEAISILGHDSNSQDKNALRIWSGQSQRLGVPVIGVTWYEAVAYCRWLTRKLRDTDSIGPDDIIRLPTISEWMAIAELCANGRRFPFGNQITPEVANTGLLSLDGPSVPGLFPPCGPGLYDFGSNVRCWAIADADEGNVWPPKPAPVSFDRGGAYVGLQRACGGSWACDEEGVFEAAGSPTGYDPARRRRICGFRIVRVPNSSPSANYRG